MNPRSWRLPAVRLGVISVTWAQIFRIWHSTRACWGTRSLSCLVLKDTRGTQLFTAMSGNLPQELVDLIVDHFVDLIGPTPEVRAKSLRMCALTARSFVRPCQIHLFSRVYLSIGRDSKLDASMPRKLSTLLLSSPHFGAYIRTLTLDGLSDPECLSHILCSLPNLEKIDARSQGNAPQAWRFAPAAVPASFLVACAAPSLRCIALHGYFFKDARELEALLWNAPNLKELALWSVRFEQNSPPRPPVPSPGRVPVVLDSL
ncbi:hypothetical protein B0H17DRAFT_355808 [Mycena rosella]|uniref:F-box domain-containing protein n=1 Tax=Mycena rosella TaxID=1033263 RepID=A0AAD7GNQ2_MYCRO|nr:hypothetical protein B0H17DRAFT_355808 [Mycena rosella]